LEAPDDGSVLIDIAFFVASCGKAAYGCGWRILLIAVASTLETASTPLIAAPTKQEKHMLMSTDRILVSHVGSLPRPEILSNMLIRQEAGEPIDAVELARQVEIATAHAIGRQVEAGVDVGNDGEQSRVGFQTYVPRCLCGFGGESNRPPARDQVEFPSYGRQTAMRFPHSARVSNAPAALSDVRYVNSAPIKEDAARLKRMGSRFSECFMTAPSPGIVATTMLNQHYDSHEAYLTALAKALSNEYRAIHDAGLILQIDSPDLAMERHRFFGHLTEAEFLGQLELHVAAINLGIEGIPRDRIRLHVCWGNNDGPHVHDVAMAAILPELCRANVGALSIEFANPRHQHEYSALRKNPLPAHMLLMPGVLDTTTNIVEHPELIAQRLEEAASVVGDRERVIAGTDCGFGTFAGREYVAEEIVWVKLAAAAEGARIASRRLWGRAHSC
jgi:5-methyltetrahydropteroyltriglutamate--homocysteine methyltransferase